MKRIYVVFDQRALQDPDDASIYVAGARTLKQALKDAKGFEPCVIYSYKENGKYLEDQKFEKYLRSKYENETNASNRSKPTRGNAD